MSLTYEAKRRLIQHVASAANWRNDYDGEAVERNFDNWSTRLSGNISLQKQVWKVTPKDESRLYHGSNLKRVKIAYDATHGHKDSQRSFVQISMAEGKLEIQDESGRRIVKAFGSTFKNAENDQGQSGINIGGEQALSVHLKDKGVEIAEISELGITCAFHSNGEKIIYFEKEGQTLAFDKPTDFADTAIPASGLLNVISFDEYFARDIGINLNSDFINAAKLVVAIDMGLEPDIKLLNKLREEDAAYFLANAMEDKYDPDWTGPWQWRPKIKTEIGDISHLQQAWIDTVDFEGYYIGLPKRFGIAFRKDPDRYDFRHSADDKHHLIAQGKLLEAATDGTMAPTPILQKNPAMQTLLHILNTAGQTVQDHNDAPWSGIVLKADNAKMLGRQVREVMRDHFGADFATTSLSSINYDENHCLIAVRSDSLEQANQSVRASSRVMTMIRDGEQDIALFKDLLQEGADLKYVEPKAARSGKSFADYMSAAGNTALLKALRDEQGEREFVSAEEAPAP